MDAPRGIAATASGTRLELRVIPRSPRTAVGGVRNGRLIVRVTAPPVDQAANEAVVTAIASALDVPRRAVRVIAGAKGRNKTIDVAGLGVADVRARLSI